jgi:prepilin-type N-terminal cleavage/methylation domain-containing protein
MKTQINPRKRHHRLGARLRAGFSLVELLIVIAVIGIIAAIAIPSISGINDAATKSKAQRNAQNIASVYSAAVAAGADVSGATTVPTADALIINGASLTGTGAFAGKTFSVGTLSTTDQADAEEFLTFDNTTKTMSYDSTAAFTAN